MFEKSIKLIDIQTIVVSLIILAVCLLRVAPHINNFSPIIALAIFGSLHFKNKTQAYVVPILCLWISDYFINNFIYILFNNPVWFYEGFYWQKTTSKRKIKKRIKNQNAFKCQFQQIHVR